MFGKGSTLAASRLNTPEVGLYHALGTARQGKGYATEAASALASYAFETIRLRRIVATTTYDNSASIAVMRRLGMHIECNPYPEPSWMQVVGILENPLSEGDSQAASS